MSTHLDIRLSEHAFATLSQQATSAGKTPEELASLAVEALYARSLERPVDAVAARAEFARSCGSIDLGRPIGIANEAIDADLGQEYGATSEPA